MPGTVDVGGTNLDRIYPSKRSERCFLNGSAGVGELSIAGKTELVFAYQNVANFLPRFLAAFRVALQREATRSARATRFLDSFLWGQQHAAPIAHENLRRRPGLIEIENENLEVPKVCARRAASSCAAPANFRLARKSQRISA